jgi:hypothetical protein
MEFILEALFMVVLLLVADVLSEFWHISRTDRKCSIATLPMEIFGARENGNPVGKNSSV